MKKDLEGVSLPKILGTPVLKHVDYLSHLINAFL